MKQKIILLLTVILLSTVVLTGCGSDEPEKPRNYYGTYDENAAPKNHAGIYAFFICVVLLGGGVIVGIRKMKK